MNAWKACQGKIAKFNENKGTKKAEGPMLGSSAHNFSVYLWYQPQRNVNLPSKRPSRM